MPKTTKNISKTTSTGLKRSFSLKSRKIQFIVVIFIIALMGGGYWVYKSYADQPNEWSYDIPQGSIQTGNTPTTVEGRKNGKTVVLANYSNSFTVSIPGTPWPTIPANTSYRICMWTDSEDPQFTISQYTNTGKLKYHGNSTATTTATFSKPEIQKDGNGYYFLCTFKRTRAETMQGPITFINKGPTTRVSSVYIRFVSPARTEKNWYWNNK